MSDLVSLTITRLQGQDTGLLDIADAASLAALVERQVAPPRAPAAYVVELATSAEPARLATGGTDQRVRSTVAVILAVRDAGKASGGGLVRTSIETLKSAVIQALHGWAPSGDHSPCELVRSDLIALTRGHVWHQVEFATHYHLRS